MQQRKDQVAALRPQGSHLLCTAAGERSPKLRAVDVCFLVLTWLRRLPDRLLSSSQPNSKTGSAGVCVPMPALLLFQMADCRRNGALYARPRVKIFFQFNTAAWIKIVPTGLFGRYMNVSRRAADARGLPSPISPELLKSAPLPWE